MECSAELGGSLSKTNIRHIKEQLKNQMIFSTKSFNWICLKLKLENGFSLGKSGKLKPGITTVWRIEIDKYWWLKSSFTCIFWLKKLLFRRGQTSKNRPALQGKSSENSEDFALNQNAIIPNPKPATLKPISRNENAMNTIRPNQTSQTIPVSALKYSLHSSKFLKVDSTY
ncbi:hypothetical protein BpHYR1_048881 [Brachionus plicatilis]|uniref:Uncharacterized protein n=1 Tax=Brachionus plicatilis TaxID=10195 RepID=A0A3M7QJQ6_BRAPC|nr:hypothetical protein BpHYR1_048881 [Brachionus plicatilis]